MSTTRADLRDRLHLGASNPTKTFVLDVHTHDPETYLADLVGVGSIERTDDVSLHGVHVEDGVFWVDQADSRFWSFHTDMPAEAAHKFLHQRVESRRDLDWMWLPSEHLRHAAPGTPARRVKTEFSGQGLLGPGTATSRLRLQASGAGADRLLDYLAQNDDYRSAVSLEGIQVDVGDDDFGPLVEAVTRLGRFAASGDSLELHMQFVRSVVDRYSAFVRALEAKAIGWDPFDGRDGGGTMHGQPVVIAFTREIPDLHRFTDEILASRVPFRLWGIPQISPDNGAGPVMHVDAVDLHVGQRLRMEIGLTWMRVYLERGACGNTVARLVSNLQHRFDSALRLLDPELNAGLTAQTASLGTAAN